MKRSRLSAGSTETSTYDAAVDPPGSVLRRIESQYHYWRNIFSSAFALADPLSDKLEPEEYRTLVQELELRPRYDGCSFSNFTELVRSAGDFHDNFISIHVTGTNGKGTVAHKIADQLQSYGLRPVGLFTSPHVFTIRERFVIDDRPISALDLASLIKTVNEIFGTQLRFFHACTLISFLWFWLRKIKVAVIEVGIGGDLDPTNILNRPACCVITSISLDHQNILGNDEAEIAEKKAGIIKRGALVVIGPQIRGRALESILSRAEKLKCEVLRVQNETVGHTELRVDQINGLIAYETVRWFVRHAIEPPLPLLGLPLSSVVPPGRLEHILPNVIVDGGHNLAALRQAGKYAAQRSNAVYLGIALSKRRGLEVFDGLVEALGGANGGVIRRVRYVHYQHPFARPQALLERDLSEPHSISPLLRESWNAGEPHTTEETVAALLRESAKERSKGLVLFCGTFYAIAAIRSAIGSVRPF